MSRKQFMQKEQSAFSPVIIIIIVGLIIAAAGGYYFMSSKSGGSNPLTSNPVVKAKIEKELADIKDPLIRKHFAAQLSQTTFRTTTKSSGRGEPSSVTEIQMKGESLYYRTIELDNNNKETSHMISMGDTTYVKDYTDGKWWKQTSKPATKTASTEVIPTPESFKDELDKKKDTTQYNKLGEEVCGTLTCYKYEEIDSANKENSRIFWFDNKDFLLRKEQYKFGEFTTTAEYSYDNISINAPSPTKEVPAGKNIYEYLSTGAAGSTLPTNQDIENAQKQLQNWQNEVAPTVQENQEAPTAPDVPAADENSANQ